MDFCPQWRLYATSRGSWSTSKPLLSAAYDLSPPGVQPQTEPVYFVCCCFFINFIRGIHCVAFLWCHATYVADAVRLARPPDNGTVGSGNSSQVCRTELNWTTLLGGNWAFVTNPRFHHITTTNWLYQCHLSGGANMCYFLLQMTLTLTLSLFV